MTNQEVVALIGAVVSVFGFIVTAAVTIYVWLAKYVIQQKEQELQRRFHETNNKVMALEGLLAKEIDKIEKLQTALTEDEKQTIRLEGHMKLLQADHEGFQADVQEIRERMVTKDEFRQLLDRSNSMDHTLRQILTQLAGPARSMTPFQTKGPSDPPSPYRKDPK